MTRKPFTSRKPAFMGAEWATSPKESNLAIFGAPHGTPYRGIDNRMHQTAPDAFRQALKFDSGWVEHYDFDFGGKLLPDDNFVAVDLGNLATKPADGKGNRKKIEAMTRSIVDAGAIPIMLGGDDSVPIPFLKGFAGGPALTIVQIDAHIDWRDERENETQGFSSTMRRASEMEHVWRIVQAGQRGLGSAREGELNAALGWGARLVSAKKIHREGVASVLEHIEEDAPCVICLDLDALDSAVMPAVAAPSPGGLNYLQLTELIAGIATKGKIAGFAMVEFVAKRDPLGTCAYTAGRIALHVMAQVAGQKK
jgi:agmatinase